MKRKLAMVFQKKTQREWIRIFKHEVDCCCTPVNDLGQAVSFLSWLGQKELFYLKDSAGRKFPQWLFPWGNDTLSRKKHRLPPRLKR